MSDHTKIVSPNGRVTWDAHDSGFLVQHIDGVNVARFGVPVPAEPEPPPIDHPNPLVGTLSPVNILDPGAHFADDTGERLPVGLSWFSALDLRRTDPAAFRRELAAITDAGYQYARVLFAVADTTTQPYWLGHEVLPVGVTLPNGQRLPAWPDYEDQVVGLGRDCAAAGLQLFVTCGGLQTVFPGDEDACGLWAMRLGELLRESGARVAFADVNEPWQNSPRGSEPSPEDVARFFTNPFEAGYGQPFIRLCGAAFNSEVTSELNRWALPSDCTQKHGRRGPLVDSVRVARGLYYPGDGPIPSKRVGVESEPPREGRPDLPWTRDAEAMCLLAASNYIGRWAFTFHSRPGTRHWLGDITQSSGFIRVPKVAGYLPPDLNSAFTTAVHGGLNTSPLTDGQGFPNGNRVDGVLADDGRFVYEVYGNGNQHTLLTARVPVSFRIITPDTGAAHSFTMQAGESLDIYYVAGRILVGAVL